MEVATKGLRDGISVRRHGTERIELPMRFYSTTRLGKHGPRPRPIAERFWEKVDRSGGPTACWPWLGSQLEQGYGYLTIGSTVDGSRRKMLAHVLSHRLAHMDDPQSEIAKWPCVLHTCDNPPCVNPFHLFAGTIADNNHDMAAKGRSRQGERNHWSRLTEAEVREIARGLGEGASAEALSRCFNVSPTTVHRIGQRTTWKHLW